MTGFDFVVLLIVGVAAIGGFLRGFVHEVLALVAWIAALFAIRYLHAPLTGFLETQLPTQTGAGVLGFALLLLVPYIAIKLLAKTIGAASRNSVLGPVDRVLGFGFGGLKGLIIVVLGFSVLVLGYDVVWGREGRPEWISLSRSYPLIDASSEALVTLIAERRERRDRESANQPSA